MKVLSGIAFAGAIALSATTFAAPITPIEAKSNTSSSYVAAPFYMVGIYEPNNEHGWRINENGDFVHFRERGDATVYIEEQSSSDVVLALGSYEPTDWKIKGPGADNVVKIIIHGYHKSTVTGAQSHTEVLDYTYSSSSSNYLSSVYNWDHSKREQVVSNLEDIAGESVSAFTGLYNAESFIIDAH